MMKALTILGMAISILILVLFGLDLAIGIPFRRASFTFDLVFVICAIGLGYLSWSTFKEQE